MTRDELLDLFRRSGALLEGHFRLTSGLHSSGYLQCALVLQHPHHAETLGRAIAARTRDLRATLVLSPALGGVVIAHEVGRALGVRAIFAERQDGVLMLRRGFVIGEGDRVLVVEDVLTTGGSTRETMRVALAAGGQVVGSCAGACYHRGVWVSISTETGVNGASMSSMIRNKSAILSAAIARLLASAAPGNPWM